MGVQLGGDMVSSLGTRAEKGHDAVEQAGAHALGAMLCRTIDDHAIDHVVAAQPQLVHLRQQLQGVLKVGIDQQHGIATRMVNACRQRRLLAKVAR